MTTSELIVKIRQEIRRAMDAAYQFSCNGHLLNILSLLEELESRKEVVITEAENELLLMDSILASYRLKETFANEGVKEIFLSLREDEKDAWERSKSRYESTLF